MLCFSKLLVERVGTPFFTANQVSQHRRNWVRDPATGKIVSRDQLNQNKPNQDQNDHDNSHPGDVSTVAGLD